MSEQMWEADMPAEPPPVTVERVEPAAEAPANPWPRTPTAPAGQGGDEKPAPDPLKLFKPVTLQGKPVPDREWLVQDWIPMGVVSAFYGDGGMGKTLLAQQLMTSCVTGKPWLGLPVMRVPVIGFFCEDSIDELHRRQADINAAYGCDFADLVDAVWISRLGFDNLLMTFHQGVGELTPTYDLFAMEARLMGARVAIVDTVADTFGGNENDRGQVRQFVQAALGKLALEINGCVIALAHPSREGMRSGTGDSGSTGWSNAFRSRAYLDAPPAEGNTPPDASCRILTRKKANYAARGQTIELHWQNGVLIPDRQPTGIEAHIQRKTAERVFLDLLDRVMAEGQYVSHKPNGNYAPRIFSQRPDRERFTKADFQRAMHALFAAREIRVGSIKTEQRKTVECLVREVAPSHL